jgi:hypothetical protein
MDNQKPKFLGVLLQIVVALVITVVVFLTLNSL